LICLLRVGTESLEDLYHLDDLTVGSSQQRSEHERAAWIDQIITAEEEIVLRVMLEKRRVVSDCSE
jgi:hypothetical protein